METPKIQSQINQWARCVAIIGFLFGGSIGCYLFFSVMKREIVWILLLSLFWGGSLVSLSTFWISFPRLSVYSDRFELSNYGGYYHKIVFWKDVRDIEIVYRETEHYSWEECVIRTLSNRTYRIPEMIYTNYRELKIELIMGHSGIEGF